MKNFFLFRTNLTNLESYHQYKNIDDFKNNLWDFYIWICIWLLENTECEQSTVFRLTKNKSYSIKFKLPNNKIFIQRFVKSFDECFKYDKPNVSLFRGAFPEYDNVVKRNHKFFGLKLYLGASKRVYPIYNFYDKILIEDERDIKNNYIPFYKTGSPTIFKPLDLNKKYDLCWSCNFSQIKYKGHEYFIKQISQSKILKKLKIVHVGNNHKIGIDLCKRYNVNNIQFLGYKNRFELNEILNKSKFGIVTSNNKDGCPRISFEILSSGTPLLIRNETRILNYYKDLECVNIFKDNKLENIYINSEKNYNIMKSKNLEYLNSYLNMNNIMKKNIKLWED